MSRCALLFVPLTFAVACSGGGGAGSGTPSVGSSGGGSPTAPPSSTATVMATATATPRTATPSPGPAGSSTPIGIASPIATPTSSTATSNVATYAGCPVFTAGDWYNADVTSAPADPNSAAYVASLGATDPGDFAASVGIEQVNLASSATPQYAIRQKVPYHSFPAPEPWNANFYIEPGGGDAHSIVLEVSPPACTLYELYETSFSGNQLSAYSGVRYDLSKPFTVLPAGTPSSMASGLSLFAGMVKFEEIAGGIHHALNVTAPAGSLCRCFIAPASDDDGLTYAGPSTAYEMPYGAHLRLRASFDDSAFGPQSRAIAEAMKHYGVFIADTSSSGNAVYTSNPLGPGAWDRADLAALGTLRIADFDVVASGAEQAQRRSGR